VRHTISASVFIFALFAATAAFADCQGPTLDVNVADQTLGVTFQTVAAPPLEVGQDVTVTIGSTVLHTSVARKHVDDLLGTVFALKRPAEAKFEGGMLVINGALNTNEARMSFTDKAGTTQSVTLCVAGDFASFTSQSFHVGLTQATEARSSSAPAATPAAMARTLADNAPAADKPSAVRVQYGRSFRRFVPHGNDTTKIPEARNAEEVFDVSVDTTDKKDKAFVDDNRISGAYFMPRMTFGKTVNRLHAGIRGEHARAVHGGDHNSDVTLALEGGLPMFQALTLSGPAFAAEPLQFRLGGGHRWQNVSTVQSSGPVAEGSLLYHVYPSANYRIDLEYATLFNGVSHRAATTPRTQHSWKASVFMFGDSKFSGVASYENGHSGPVFTNLKQYFVGVGLANFLSTVAPRAKP
jgi:hypothetical protein